MQDTPNAADLAHRPIVAEPSPSQRDTARPHGDTAQPQRDTARPPRDTAWPGLLAAIVWPAPAWRLAAGTLGLGLVVTMFWLGSQPSASNFIPTPPWDRLLHFVVYGGYATLAWIASGGRWLPAVLAAALIGLADEGLQSLSPGRTADWTDIAADIAGALVAVWVLGALRRRLGRETGRGTGRGFAREPGRKPRG